MLLIIATHNSDKLKEIQQLLTGLAIEVKSADDVGITEDIVEDGHTLEENALKKARYVAQKSRELTVADDTGLFIDALDGKPGIYAARWAGEGASGKQILEHTLSELKSVPLEKRTARFESVIALVSPEGKEWLFRGIVNGSLAKEPHGASPEKLPYDALFIPEGESITYAEMPQQKKNTISHRAKAFQAFADFFKKQKNNFLTFFIFTLGGLFWTSPALAHVSYVLEKEVIEQKKGLDFVFLASAFDSPQIVVLSILAFGILALGAILLKRSIFFVREIAFVRKEAESYHDLIPWMLRLTLGIALIGAGTDGFLISPIMPASASEGFLQILTGFLLLSGFLLTPATLLAALLFTGMIFRDPASIIGTLNVAALIAILFIKGNPRPGIDDIFRIPLFTGLKRYDFLSPLILRIGLGICFIGLGLYEKILNPHMAQEVVLQYGLQGIVPVSAAVWVLGAGIVECVLGLLLVVGLQTRLVSAVSFLVLILSFFFFKEEVYSHITLFGALSILFVSGAGRASIDAILAKRYREKIST